MALHNKFILSLLKAIRESEDDYWMRQSLDDFIAVSQEGGIPMEWKSPWEPCFHFFISRYENTVQSSDPKEGLYTIEIKVADGYYTHLIDLRLSENDLFILIDEMDFFTYDMEDARPESNIIFPFHTDANMNTPQLVLERIDVESEFKDDCDFIKSPYYDKTYDAPRDIRFIIRNYNSFYQTIAPICTFYLSNEELCNFAYDLFFVGLIDLDLDSIQETIGSNIDIDQDIRNMFLDLGMTYRDGLINYWHNHDLSNLPPESKSKTGVEVLVNSTTIFNRLDLGEDWRDYIEKR